MLQAIDYGGFEMVTSDRVFVITGAFVARIGAADADLVPDHGGAVALAAFHQAGEQIFGASSIAPIAVLDLLVTARRQAWPGGPSPCPIDPDRRCEAPGRLG
ncbi:MAG: hypothetical protein AAGA73_00555 [Pseudomonadota bacterium]